MVCRMLESFGVRLGFHFIFHKLLWKSSHWKVFVSVGSKRMSHAQHQHTRSCQTCKFLAKLAMGPDGDSGSDSSSGEALGVIAHRRQRLREAVLGWMNRMQMLGEAVLGWMDRQKV